jgi:hypothetical protein
MLIYNLSRKLRNGTRGRVDLLEDDGVTVELYHNENHKTHLVCL